MFKRQSLKIRYYSKSASPTPPRLFLDIKDLNFNAFYPSVRLTLDLPIKTKHLDSIDFHIKDNIPLDLIVEDKSRFEKIKGILAFIILLKRYLNRPYFLNAQDWKGQTIPVNNATNGMAREYFVTFRFPPLG